jgi:hypothetical protein
MTETDLECLKSHIDQRVEIVTRNGERLLIKVISVFDEQSDPDIFFWDLTSNPEMLNSEHSQGYSLPFAEIVSVKHAN